MFSNLFTNKKLIIIKKKLIKKPHCVKSVSNNIGISITLAAPIDVRFKLTLRQCGQCLTTKCAAVEFLIRKLLSTT